MTEPNGNLHADAEIDATGETPGLDDGPQSVPPRIWVTLVGFAAFVILFGTCAAQWMFN